MAQHYNELPIEKWNTAHFQNYIRDKHVECYGIQYVALGGVVAERSQLARFIGSKKVKGMYDKETVKVFLDMCFANYKPNPRYPGLSFSFMSRYMTQELQRAELEVKRKQAQQVTEGVDVEWL